MVKHFYFFIFFFHSFSFSNLYLSLEIMKYECKHNKSEFSGKLYEDAVNLLHIKDKINLPQGAGNWQHPSWRPLCPFPGPSGHHGVWAAMPQAAAFLPNKWQPSYRVSCVVALTVLLHIPNKPLESLQNLPRKTIWVYKEDRGKTHENLEKRLSSPKQATKPELMKTFLY